LFEADASFPRHERLAACARPARFHCADRIAATAVEKAALRAATGADAVEMESGAIRGLCRTEGIACATLRVVSDLAGEDLPFDFNRLSRADHSLDLPRLLLALAKSPTRLRALLRLQRQCAEAARKLADALERIMASS
jgi:nucleoside phosphorylase